MTALPEDYASDFQVFKSLLAKFKKGEKAHAVYRGFDADEQKFERNEMTFVKKTTVEHAGEDHEGYEIKHVTPMGPSRSRPDTRAETEYRPQSP